MRALIAEDNYTSRILIQRLLAPHAECTVVVNGEKAVEAFLRAFYDGRPYDLICLDLMMPEMDGHTALTRIREIEKERGIEEAACVKVIMTTAHADVENVRKAIREKCQGYLIKPYDKQKLLDKLTSLGLLKEVPHENTDC